MSADLALARIEAILGEIEQLEFESNGQFRQASDREANQIAARIERKMLANRKTESVA